MPNAINYTQARNNLAATMDEVCDTHEPVIITRQKAQPVVMLSLDDYNNLIETEYLLSNKKNAKRLLESIQQAENGLANSHDVLDVE